MKKARSRLALIVTLSIVLTMLFSTMSVNAASWNLNDSNRARYAGQNRYETSLQIADALKKSLGVSQFDTVVLAYGGNYPDALAGGYLANINDAPIITVDSIHKNGSNPSSETDVINYLESNLKRGGKVYILGGAGSVSERFENKLKSRYSVERLAGSGRYGTNLEILNEVGTSSDALLVCSGNGFADSLSVSAVDIPVLLVNKTLTAEQRAYIASVKPSKIYIIGGTSAVGTSIENDLKSSNKNVARIAGPNRYATSVAIAKEFFESDVLSTIVLAYGKNFPDGLSGGPLAASLSAPLVLTETDSYTAAQAYRQSTSISLCATLGGKTLISDYAVEEIMRESNEKIKAEIAKIDEEISKLEKEISETEEKIEKVPSSEEKAAAASEKEKLEAELAEKQDKLEEKKKELEDASAKTTAAKKKMDESSNAKDSAEEEAAKADAANKAAEGTLAEIQKEIDKTTADIADVDKQLEEQNQALKDAEGEKRAAEETLSKAIEAAKKSMTDALADLETAKSDEAAAKEASEKAEAAAKDARAQLALGDAGFFQWMADNGYSPNPALREVDGENITEIEYIINNEMYVSLDNVQKAINVVERTNELRVAAGKSELKVDPFAMVLSRIQVDWEAKYYAENGGLSHYSEGLKRFISVYGATGYAENLALGYNDPTDGWYKKEATYLARWMIDNQDKVVWSTTYTADEISELMTLLKTESANTSMSDEAITKMSSMINVGSTSAKYDSNAKSTYGTVGHYFNLMNEGTKSTSSAWNGRMSVANYLFGPFNRSKVGSYSTYTVSEYQALYDEYSNSINDSVDAANEALATYNAAVKNTAEKQAAVDALVDKGIGTDGTVSDSVVADEMAACDKAEAKIESINKDIESLSASRDELEETLAEEESRKEEAAKTAEETKIALDAANESLEIASAKLEEDTAAYNELKATEDTIKKEIEEIEQSITDINSAIQAAEEIINNSDDKESLTETLNSLKAQLEDARNRKADLEKQLN